MICANVMKSSPLIILTLQGLSLRVKAVLIRPLESGEGYNTAPNSFHKQVSVDKQNQAQLIIRLAAKSAKSTCTGK